MGSGIAMISSTSPSLYAFSISVRLLIDTMVDQAHGSAVLTENGFRAVGTIILLYLFAGWKPDSGRMNLPDTFIPCR